MNCQHPNYNYNYAHDKIRIQEQLNELTSGAKPNYPRLRLSLLSMRAEPKLSFDQVKPKGLRSRLSSCTTLSRLSYQVSIKYWCMSNTFSIFVSICEGCEFRDVTSEKLPRLFTPKKTLILGLTKFLVLKPFSKPLSYNPNIIQRTGNSIR